ncbi:unnamed protein product [Plutella xylostella]|uniref:(diamondback moth) hypothetical protein n=1 Tax=Plutella xylostella TaxID=51655 RepID=A0A8S4G6H8_PLUXY|nr:unnamed protein product [Plutella xylostella]
MNNLSQNSSIHHKDPTVFITTDASDQVWGAIVNSKKMNGIWTPLQQSWHSNQKELWTLKEVMRQVAYSFKQKTILVQTDNKSVTAYITKEGGTKSQPLLRLTQDIFEIAQRFQIHIIARYLPGRYNLTADSLSRFCQTPEWTLSEHVTQAIFEKWGTPSIDLFASYRSAVVECYVSEDACDPASAYVNAFSRPWNYKLGWIFPPPSLIPRILRHLQKSSGVYLLVIPKWEKTFWKSELKQRAMCPPFRIWNLRRHLVDLKTGLPPPMVEKIHLQVWKVQAGPIY